MVFFFAGVTMGWVIMDITNPIFAVDIYAVIGSIGLFLALIGRTIFQDLIRNLKKKTILQNQNIKRNKYIKDD